MGVERGWDGAGQGYKGITVVLTGAVVAVAADRLVGGQLLQPVPVIGVQPCSLSLMNTLAVIWAMKYIA